MLEVATLQEVIETGTFSVVKASRDGTGVQQANNEAGSCTLCRRKVAAASPLNSPLPKDRSSLHLQTNPLSANNWLMLCCDES